MAVRIIDLFFPEPCSVCEVPILRGRVDSSPICSNCREELPKPCAPLCEICGSELISEHNICTRCRKRSFSLRANRSIYNYDGAVRELIHRYKFEGQSNLAEFFAAGLAECYRSEERSEPIVPVPPRPRKRRNRGTHISRIAKILNREFDIEIAALLERKPGPPQKTLDYERRLANPKGKFMLAKKIEGETISGRDFLLLDDVLTTGATLDACAGVLLNAGAAKVESYTLALD